MAERHNSPASKSDSSADSNDSAKYMSNETTDETTREPTVSSTTGPEELTASNLNPREQATHAISDESTPEHEENDADTFSENIYDARPLQSPVQLHDTLPPASKTADETPLDPQSTSSSPCSSSYSAFRHTRSVASEDQYDPDGEPYPTPSGFRHTSPPPPFHPPTSPPNPQATTTVLQVTYKRPTITTIISYGILLLAIGFFGREFCYPCATITRRPEELILDYIAELKASLSGQTVFIENLMWVVYYLARYTVFGCSSLALNGATIVLRHLGSGLGAVRDTAHHISSLHSRTSIPFPKILDTRFCNRPDALRYTRCKSVGWGSMGVAAVLESVAGHLGKAVPFAAAGKALLILTALLILSTPFWTKLGYYAPHHEILRLLRCFLRAFRVAFPPAFLSHDELKKSDIAVILSIANTSEPGSLNREWETMVGIAKHNPKKIVLLTKPENVEEMETLVNSTREFYKTTILLSEHAKLPPADTSIEVLWHIPARDDGTNAFYSDADILAVAGTIDSDIIVWQSNSDAWPSPDKFDVLDEVQRTLKPKDMGRATVKVSKNATKFRILSIPQEEPAQWNAGEGVKQMPTYTDPRVQLYMDRDVSIVLPAKVWVRSADGSPTSLDEVLHKIIISHSATDPNSTFKGPHTVTLICRPQDKPDLQKFTTSWTNEHKESDTDLRIKVWDEISPTTVQFSASPTATRFDFGALPKKIFPDSGLSKTALPKDLSLLGIGDSRVIVIARAWNKYTFEFDLLTEVLRRLNASGNVKLNRTYVVMQIEGRGLRCIIHDGGRSVEYLDVLIPAWQERVDAENGNSSDTSASPGLTSGDSEDVSSNTSAESLNGRKASNASTATDSMHHPELQRIRSRTENRQKILRDLLLFLKNKFSVPGWRVTAAQPERMAPHSPGEVKEGNAETGIEDPGTLERGVGDWGKTGDDSPPGAPDAAQKDGLVLEAEGLELLPGTTVPLPIPSTLQPAGWLSTIGAACRPTFTKMFSRKKKKNYGEYSDSDEHAQNSAGSDVSSTPSSPIYSQWQIDASNAVLDNGGSAEDARAAAEAVGDSSMPPPPPPSSSRPGPSSSHPPDNVPGLCPSGRSSGIFHLPLRSPNTRRNLLFTGRPPRPYSGPGPAPRGNRRGDDPFDPPPVHPSWPNTFAGTAPILVPNPSAPAAAPSAPAPTSGVGVGLGAQNGDGVYIGETRQQETREQRRKREADEAEAGVYARAAERRRREAARARNPSIFRRIGNVFGRIFGFIGNSLLWILRAVITAFMIIPWAIGAVLSWFRGFWPDGSPGGSGIGQLLNGSPSSPLDRVVEQSPVEDPFGADTASNTSMEETRQPQRLSGYRPSGRPRIGNVLYGGLPPRMGNLAQPPPPPPPSGPAPPPPPRGRFSLSGQPGGVPNPTIEPPPPPVSGEIPLWRMSRPPGVRPSGPAGDAFRVSQSATLGLNQPQQQQRRPEWIDPTPAREAARASEREKQRSAARETERLRVIAEREEKERKARHAARTEITERWRGTPIATHITRLPDSVASGIFAEIEWMMRLPRRLFQFLAAMPRNIYTSGVNLPSNIDHGVMSIPQLPRLIYFHIDDLPQRIQTLIITFPRRIRISIRNTIRNTRRTVDNILLFLPRSFTRICPWLVMIWLTMIWAHTVIAKTLLGLFLSWLYAESELFRATRRGPQREVWANRRNVGGNRANVVTPPMQVGRLEYGSGTMQAGI